MTLVHRRIVLASRPSGAPNLDNFRLESAEITPIEDGQVLVRHHFLSLDPYMRGRMNDTKSYAAPQPLDKVMIGGTAGVIVESKHPDFSAGDTVVGMGGWQEYQKLDSAQIGSIRKVDTRKIPLSAYLGAVGMPGVTAWYGLTQICSPKPGETVVVSAASGAVGSAVGQLAKARGCTVIGVAGGPAKCKHVVEDLGFDHCLDYKAMSNPRELVSALSRTAPRGIDAYFDNVGGAILDAVMARMNAFGRIAICGMISGYNGEPIPMSTPQLILVSRLTLRGFIVSEHLEHWPAALSELGERVAAGSLKYHESIARGLEAAPEAFLGLLQGKNLGKQLVKLVDD